MDTNRRSRSRVEIHRNVVFVPITGEEILLETRNVSLKGMLAAPNPCIKTNEAGLVRITLAEDVLIETDCVIVRSDEGGIAVRFLAMEPESFLHLRNLVRYNAEDADLIDQELSAPLFT